jgi:transcriptional regulator with XRE-family HTH domain
MLQLERLDEGTRTRLLRVAAGLSQHDLASRAGLDRRRLSEHERGERPLRGVELARVHDALERASPQPREGFASAVA